MELITLELITSLPLRAINQTWQLQYEATTNKGLKHVLRVGEQTRVLTLFGETRNIRLTHMYLGKWLQQTAKKYFPDWLQALSQKHGLAFNKVTIRGQRTLWGSCNSTKNISLNYKLLFLPPPYVEHLMLHELCHTKHLNHSKRFWDLLQKLDPHCDQHNKGIRQANSLVPYGL